MQLNIPELGTKLVLTQNWHFKLILEHRNNKLIEHLYKDEYHIEYSYRYYYQDIQTSLLKTKSFIGLVHLFTNSEERQKSNWQDYYRKLYIDNPDKLLYEDDITPIIFPIGTQLTIDRIYIRKGKSNYSSVSFWALLPGQKKKIRMFAKLNDVNQINY